MCDVKKEISCKPINAIIETNTEAMVSVFSLFLCVPLLVQFSLLALFSQAALWDHAIFVTLKCKRTT